MKRCAHRGRRMEGKNKDELIGEEEWKKRGEKERTKMRS